MDSSKSFLDPLQILKEERSKRKTALKNALEAWDEIEQHSQIYCWCRNIFDNIGRWIWAGRLLIIGLLLGLVLVGFRLPSLTTILPNNTVVSKAVTAAQIEAAAPPQADARKTLTRVLDEVSVGIDDGDIKKKSDVRVYLTTELAPLVANKDWDKTFEAIDKQIDSASDLQAVQKKIQELSEVFRVK